MGRSGGWRDTDGRTARERRRLSSADARARFIETVRRRPLNLVKSTLMIAAAALLIMALLLRFW
jgi:hypothetical protein